MKKKTLVRDHKDEHVFLVDEDEFEAKLKNTEAEVQKILIDKLKSDFGDYDGSVENFITYVLPKGHAD